jgi:carboxylesterase
MTANGPIDRSIYLSGNRTGVLLIHGLGGTPVELKSVARAYADAGCTVFCCQLAGHCGTEAELVATNRHDWMTSVEYSLRRLRQDCDVVFAGGLSMGAILALKLARQHPTAVDGLLLFAPTLWYDGWAIPWMSFLLRWLIHMPMAHRWRFRERQPYGIKDERLRDIILRAMQTNTDEAGHFSTPASVIRQFWLLVDEVLPDLPHIRTPAFVAHAREDDLSSLKNALHIQSRLAGIVETLILDDSYHLITIDRQRTLLVERSWAFVDTYSTRARCQRSAAACSIAGPPSGILPASEGTHCGAIISRVSS